MEKTQFIFPLIGIVGILSLVGIVAATPHSKSYESYKEKKEQVIEKPTKEKVGKYEINKISYEGHLFLFFDQPSRTGIGGVLHDPNCPCQKK